MGGFLELEEGVLILFMFRELGGLLVEWDRWELFRLILGRRFIMIGKNCWFLVL